MIVNMSDDNISVGREFRMFKNEWAKVKILMKIIFLEKENTKIC